MPLSLSPWSNFDESPYLYPLCPRSLKLVHTQEDKFTPVVPRFPPCFMAYFVTSLSDITIIIHCLSLLLSPQREYKRTQGVSTTDLVGR